MKFLICVLFVLASTFALPSSSSSLARQRRDQVLQLVADAEKHGLRKPDDPIAISEAGVNGSLALAEGEKGGNVIVKGSQVRPAPVPVPAPKDKPLTTQEKQATNITVMETDPETYAYPEQGQSQSQTANVSTVSRKKPSFSTVTAQRGNITRQRTNININTPTASRQRTNVNLFPESRAKEQTAEQY